MSSLEDIKMKYIVIIIVAALFIFFLWRKFKKASEGKDCCK